jgi:predicted transcriptional regulator
LGFTVEEIFMQTVTFSKSSLGLLFNNNAMARLIDCFIAHKGEWVYTKDIMEETRLSSTAITQNTTLLIDLGMIEMESIHKQKAYRIRKNSVEMEGLIKLYNLCKDNIDVIRKNLRARKPKKLR